MVLGGKWNRQLNIGPKLQSSLGRVEEVYSEKSDSLVMARVIKVNYIYNTVDVLTIKNAERLVKDNSTQGKFSAQLPVPFGGSFSNGDTYGTTIPINIGDYVLIGFLDKDNNSPIVINIYKSPDTSFQLAPTDIVSGDPEDSNISKKVMESFTLFPSQTYFWNDGLGNVERTYQGKSFFRSSLAENGNGRINDYGYSYDELYRTSLRGRDIVPYSIISPQVLYQHTGDNIDIVNNLLFDDDGDVRLSSYSKSNGNRLGLYIDGLANIGFSYQEGDPEHGSEDAKNVSKISITKGIPEFSYGNHTLSYNSDGLIYDGKSIGDWGGNSDLEKQVQEIETELKALQDKVNTLNVDEILAELAQLSDKVNNEIIKDLANLTDTVNGFDANIQQALRSSEQAQALSEATAKTISDAAGTDASLIARLDRIDQVIKSMQDIMVEVISARTFNVNGHTYTGINSQTVTYSSLGKRLDTIEDMVRADRDRLNDLVNKLDIFLSDDFSKGVASYVVTIQAYGDTIMRNGQGSVTLEAKLFKAGFEWTSLVDDGAFVWTRESDDTSGDITWNQNNLDGKKSITLTSVDFGYSANFRVSVTVQGHIINS